MPKGKTELELLKSQQQNLFLLEKLLLRSDIKETDLSDIIPGMFHLNSRKDMTIQYLSQSGLDYFGMTLQELHDLGSDFFDRCLAKETQEYVMPKFAAFSAANDSHACYSDFQIVRRDRNDKFQGFISNLKIIKSLDVFAVVTIPIQSFGEAAKKMERILGEQKFFRDNFERFQSLTKRELEILTLIAQGITNKEIGEQLFLSTNTVRTHRNRIFKKLEVKNLAQLIKYAYAYDVI